MNHGLLVLNPMPWIQIDVSCVLLLLISYVENMEEITCLKYRALMAKTVRRAQELGFYWKLPAFYKYLGNPTYKVYILIF